MTGVIPTIAPLLEADALDHALGLLEPFLAQSSNSTQMLARLRLTLPAMMRQVYKTREEALTAPGRLFSHFKPPHAIYRLLDESMGTIDDEFVMDGEIFVLLQRIWPDYGLYVAPKNRFLGCKDYTRKTPVLRFSPIQKDYSNA